MLEVKYDTETRLLRGWCADETRFGGLNPDEEQAVVMLDIPIPEKDPFAYLVKSDLSGLEPNPDYEEPEPPRGLAAEVDDLKARVEKLEGK